MYELKETLIEGINSFFFTIKNELIVENHQGVKKYNSNDSIFEYTKNSEALIFNDKLFVTDIDDNYFIVDVGLKNILQTGKSVGFSKLGNEQICYIKSNNTYEIYNKNLKLLASCKGCFVIWQSILIDNIWIGLKSRNCLIGYNIKSNSIDWEFNLENIKICDGKNNINLSQFSGSFQNKFLITLDNGGVVLLSAGGSVLKYWGEAKIRYWLKSVEEKGEIFWGLSHNTFIEVNVNIEIISRSLNIDNQLKTLKNIPNGSPNYTFITTSIIYNNLIYFIADNDLVGVFDPKIEKIIWNYRFEFKDKYTVLKGSEEGIKVKGNKLYILDSTGTLYIFENIQYGAEI